VRRDVRREERTYPVPESKSPADVIAELEALRRHCAERGWLGKSYLGWLDHIVFTLRAYLHRGRIQ
jgi:hypothetical protein